jgi:hypothetical protein
VLIYNAEHRRVLIANAMHLPLPGCPAIQSGIEWAQWIPGMYTQFNYHSVIHYYHCHQATAFEGVLFLWVVHKTLRSTFHKWRVNNSFDSLYSTIVKDNILYFFGCVKSLCKSLSWYTLIRSLLVASLACLYSII